MVSEWFSNVIKKGSIKRTDLSSTRGGARVCFPKNIVKLDRGRKKKKISMPLSASTAKTKKFSQKSGESIKGQLATGRKSGNEERWYGVGRMGAPVHLRGTGIGKTKRGTKMPVADQPSCYRAQDYRKPKVLCGGGPEEQETRESRKKNGRDGEKGLGRCWEDENLKIEGMGWGDAEGKRQGRR